MKLANLYLERGDNDQAIPLMKQLVELNLDNLDWPVNLGKVYEANGQNRLAEAVYEQVSQQEDHLSALLGKAIVLSKEIPKPPKPFLPRQRKPF